MQHFTHYERKETRFLRTGWIIVTIHEDIFPSGVSMQVYK